MRCHKCPECVDRALAFERQTFLLAHRRWGTFASRLTGPRLQLNKISGSILYFPAHTSVTVSKKEEGPNWSCVAKMRWMYFWHEILVRDTQSLRYIYLSSVRWSRTCHSRCVCRLRWLASLDQSPFCLSMIVTCLRNFVTFKLKDKFYFIDSFFFLFDSKTMAAGRASLRASSLNMASPFTCGSRVTSRDTPQKLSFLADWGEGTLNNFLPLKRAA